MSSPSNLLWRSLLVVVVAGVAGLRLFYLASDCPLDLAPDEAHYWDWSRHLDWSYYSKGPLVAWLIRLGCELGGQDMLAVRLPAVACGVLLLVAVYVLASQVFRSERFAFTLVLVALTLPMLWAGGALMTIDAPYTCLWAWALVAGLHAVRSDKLWAWVVAGALVGVGILAKYTMVLWVPSLALFLLFSSEHRRLLWRPGFWVMSLTGAAFCLPILVWNVQHDWVSLKHVERLAGLRRGPSFHWDGPLVYVGTQAALLLGVWFVAWACSLWAFRPWRDGDEGRRYLWWMSVPMFAVFLGFSVKTGGGEPNWPVTAYVSGLVLAAGWLAGQLQSPSIWRRRLVQGGLVFGCGIGLLLSVVMHQTAWLHPLMARVVGPPTEARPFPLRSLDPTCRLRGWRTLAEEVDRLREELSSRGIEPVLAASAWNLPGEIGFYCAGRPAVYSLGPAFGDRQSQYDLWRPNPVADPDAFRGRTFIIITGTAPQLGSAFERVEQPRVVRHEVEGRPIAGWAITVAHGYRGFRNLPGTRSQY